MGGIGKQFFGGYKTELSSLCEHGTIPLQNHAQVDFLFFCVPHHPEYSGAKLELLSNILGFYFCYPLSCPLKKRVTT